MRKLRITCNDAGQFQLIQDALGALEDNDTHGFVDHFDVAEELENVCSDRELSIVLRSTVPFKMDLNSGRKYIIPLPDCLVIDSFEFNRVYTDCSRQGRNPLTNVMIQAHIEGHNIDMLFVMTGFTSDNIRLVKASSTTCPCHSMVAEEGM